MESYNTDGVIVRVCMYGMVQKFWIKQKYLIFMNECKFKILFEIETRNNNLICESFQLLYHIILELT